MKKRTFLSGAVIFLALLLCPGFLSAEQWSTPVPVTSLNSSYRDMDAFLTADGKTLYMSSDRLGGLDLAKVDLFISHLIDGNWSTPEVLPSPPNLANYRDDMPSLTLDGHYMYFYSTRPGGYGSGDLWVSENIYGLWQAPQNLGPNINTASDDATPFITPDGQTLIFTSNRPGGYGAYDLYVSNKVDGVWQPAENMGSTLNTTYNNDHPALSYTGRWMFFSSHSEIVRAENVLGVWQTPVNIGPPVNTSADDIVTFFLDCTSTIYMADDHASTHWDIKTSKWLDAPGPNPCTRLIIPKGQWRVRVTLLEASADLSNDIYIDSPISQLLIKKSLKNVGTVVTTPFLSAEELVFHIHVNGDQIGLGEYDHYSDTEFAQVERTAPLRYIVGFEDLPADQADWDYNDTVLLVELVGVEVNIWESQNYLGENQMVQSTPADQDTALVLPLTSGAGVEATAVIPGAGLSESTFGILTEGDPVLYADLIQPESHLVPTGVFLKLELENGQTQLLDGRTGRIEIAYADEDDDGIVDGTSVAETELVLARYDEESGAWVALPSEVDPVTDHVTCAMNQFSPIFALGAWTADEEPPPVEPPANPPQADASGPMLHSTGSGSGPGCLAVAAAPDPAGWATVLGLIGLLGSRRLHKRRPR